MPQSPKSQTARLNFTSIVLPLLLAGAVVAYLVWRFLQVYIVNLGGEMEEISRLLRYFAGVLLEFLLVVMLLTTFTDKLLLLLELDVWRLWMLKDIWLLRSNLPQRR